MEKKVRDEAANGQARARYVPPTLTTIGKLEQLTLGPKTKKVEAIGFS
jgi:hypothetical protein